MSPRGVMLFHAGAERAGDFGVWRLWAELTARHPSFTFRYGHALGVLGVGASLPDSVGQLLHSTQAEAQDTRAFFLRRGRWPRMRTMVEASFKHPGQLLEAILESSRGPARGPASGA